MTTVIQRVTRAAVRVDGQIIGQCGQGLMVLLGVAPEDTEEDARVLCTKLAHMRIFCDEAGKMNRSIEDIGGSMLVVSQFTLLADTSHGNRPSFTGAGSPAHADRLYRYFTDCVREMHIPVETGSFGADMQVELVNDGPVTFVLHSSDFKKAGNGNAKGTL